MPNELLPTFATLNDLPVSALEPVSWELREGTEPVIRDFLMTTEDALELRENAGTVTLKMGIRENEFHFRNLYVMDLPPGPNEHLRYVRLADRRWLWKYVHVLRRYNMRRKVGVKRARAPGGALIVDISEDISYAIFSIKDNGDKWTAQEALEDVLERVLSKELDFAGAVPAFFVRANAFSRELPVENFELDDRGDMALQRTMSFIPGLAVFIDQVGNVVFYNKADGTEGSIVNDSKEIVERGHIELVDKRLLRPQSIRCLFTIEQEVRFDFAERTANEDAE